MPTDKKRELVKQLKEKLKKAEGVFFTDFHGVNANSLNDLRKRLSDVAADYQIVKNSLVKIAREDIDLKGPSAALFTPADPTAALRILAEFKKEIDRPIFKMGIFEDKIINADQVEVLANLPDKEVLIAHAIHVISSPLISLMNVLIGSERKLIMAINAYAVKKGGESDG